MLVNKAILVYHIKSDIKMTIKRINLFDLAEKNSGYLRNQYKKQNDNCSELQRNLLIDFSETIRKKWTLSVNMNDCPLVQWLDTGQFMNIHELKESEANELINIGGLDSSEKESAVEESLKKRLKQFYEARTIFDSAFLNGNKFKYTALNIGSSGASRYGAYCIVIEKEKVEQYNTLVFIKEDSAINYVENQQVELDRLTYDISNKSCIPFLAAIKHKIDLETTSLDQWPGMICNNNDYIEAVTSEDILSDHIECVRITRNFYNSMFNSLKRYFVGQKVSKERLYRMSFFKHIMSELKKRGIQWEVIDEN
jgi:hypothetical protein